MRTLDEGTFTLVMLGGVQLSLRWLASWVSKQISRTVCIYRSSESRVGGTEKRGKLSELCAKMGRIWGWEERNFPPRIKSLRQFEIRMRELSK